MSYAQSHVTVTMTVSEARALKLASQHAARDSFINGHVYQAAIRGHDKLGDAIRAHEQERRP